MTKHHEHTPEKAPEHTPEKPAATRKPFYTSEKFLSITFTVLFLCIAIFTAVSLRLYTVDLKLADDWAASTIKQQAITQITSSIKQSYPTLPDSAVQSEAEKQWEQFAKDHASELVQQTKLLGGQFRNQFQFEAGTTTKYNQTYVMEMDPYLYWYQAVNYADHGTVCDPGTPVQANGNCIDAKRLAPTGAEDTPNLLIYTEAYMIRAAHVLAPNLDTLTVIFYIPAILIGLTIIPIFFVGRRLGGNVGGFIAAMVFATHPVVLGQTMAGFVKVTGFNLLFAMLVVWFILEAFLAKRWWTRITLATLSGISVGLYSFSWIGWWFLFFVVLVCLIATMIYNFAVLVKRHKMRDWRAYKEFLPVLSVFAVFFVTAAISVIAFTNFQVFAFSFVAPFSYTSNLQAPTVPGTLTGWPNILTTVAELNIPSLQTIISNLGGNMIVIFAAFGLFASLFNPRKLSWHLLGICALVFIYYFILISKGQTLSPIIFLILFALPLAIAVLYIFWKELGIDLGFSIMMMGWLLATLFATTKGVRFLILGIAPFSICFGIALGWLFIAISALIAKETKKLIIVQGVVAAVILFIVFNPAASYNPLKIGDSVARQQLPGMDDGWWDAMTAIRTSTPDNTIITSWWDFGHWFRNIGNRSVTFDGGSQNPQPGHWVGSILLTSNETQALGTLRMLDCGQNNAFETASNTLDTLPAKKLIDQVILLDRAAATTLLSHTTIPLADQQIILDKSHCSPPPAVFITSGDMIGKAGVWGHFGSWDFGKALAYNYAESLPQSQAIAKIETLNYSEVQATEMYYTIRALKTQSEGNSWIAGWPGYLTQDWRGCNQNNDQVVCSLYVGVTQTSQGVFAVETVNFSASQPNNITVDYGVYNNNVKLGGSSAAPTRFVYADVAAGKLSSWNFNSDIGFGVLVRKTVAANQTSYSVLLADPSQLDSMFTQLYFLDGAFNTEHFKKLVETREPGGSRIVVWNVVWPKD